MKSGLDYHTNDTQTGTVFGAVPDVAALFTSREPSMSLHGCASQSRKRYEENPSTFLQTTYLYTLARPRALRRGLSEQLGMPMRSKEPP